MSIPEPSAPVQTVFAVPADVSAITLGGGCGESHTPQNGAVDCAACAAVARDYHFAPEQPSTPTEPETLAVVDVTAAQAVESPAAMADPPSTSKSKNRSADASA
jgi:hypothetical protein